MTKGFWAVIAAIVLIFVGIVIFSGGDKKATNSSPSDNSNLTQHVQGKGTSGVTLLEYGDYQCPFCFQYEPTVNTVKAKYGDQIKFQFRNYPIQSQHQNAFAAARAAEAADLQDKFWEMHGALYEPAKFQIWTKASAPSKHFEDYAKELGLNVTQFKTDFASSEVNDRINADLEEGNRLGVTGTPAFFVNGKKTEIANSEEAFAKVLDEAIAKAAKSNTEANQ